MSRKDPRRRMMIPVTAPQRAWLRRQAQGRSLADVLRRLVQQQLHCVDLAALTRQPCADLAALSTPDRAGLPLQLPRRVRLQVEEIAARYNLSAACVIAHLLAQQCRASAPLD